MIEEIMAYQKYLLNFRTVEKPSMPKFDAQAYTDNEYLSAIFEIINEFDFVDDEHLIIMHLKGD